MNAQSLFQLLLSGEQWGHAKVFNVNELLWLMMMTQSLRYLFIEPIDHLHHQFVNLSTSQSDILPSCVPPSTDWHIAHLWQSFCPPRAQSDILPSFGMQSFFLWLSLVSNKPIVNRINDWLKFKQRHFSNMCHQTLTPPPAMSVIHLKMDRLWPSWIEIWSTDGKVFSIKKMLLTSAIYVGDYILRWGSNWARIWRRPHKSQSRLWQLLWHLAGI